MRNIYADNSATTALAPSVLEKMMPYLTEVYGNPSSLYRIGGKAKEAVEKSRANIAKNLGAASPSEIFFTSGGSESDNWALKGVCHALKAKGKKHIITSKFEHHAILHTCAALEKDGFEVTYLDVYENGIVKPEDIETLDPSVRDHEPHLALDGGADGLDFYRVIADKWRDALLPNGLMAFEVGIGQADEVLRIMRANGFGDIQIVKDLHGIPRVVYGRLCKEI